MPHQDLCPGKNRWGKPHPTTRRKKSGGDAQPSIRSRAGSTKRDPKRERSRWGTLPLRRQGSRRTRRRRKRCAPTGPSGHPQAPWTPSLRASSAFRQIFFESPAYFEPYPSPQRKRLGLCTYDEIRLSVALIVFPCYRAGFFGLNRIERESGRRYDRMMMNSRLQGQKWSVGGSLVGWAENLKAMKTVELYRGSC